MQNRGRFILFEGLDRSGKSTQAQLLCQKLNEANLPATLLRFPDRTTPIGKLLDDYLKNKETSCNPKTAHLLFAANRWELQERMKTLLLGGTNIVCDRYAFSGVAYSSGALQFDLQWCLSADEGVISPDVIFFLRSNSRSDMLTERGCDGERYEKVELQDRIAEKFEELKKLFSKNRGQWEDLDADKSIEELSQIIYRKVTSQTSSEPLRQLWANEPLTQ